MQLPDQNLFTGWQLPSNCSADEWVYALKGVHLVPREKTAAWQLFLRVGHWMNKEVNFQGGKEENVYPEFSVCASKAKKKKFSL